MRRHILLPALLAFIHFNAAAENDFSGVWTASVCPSGVKDDPGKCAHFVLELFQKQDKLCGSHIFATPDMGEVDEGAGPSLVGQVTNEVATVTVASGRARPAGHLPVELHMDKGKLQWRRLDKPGRDDLLPVNARFSKSRAKSMLNPVFAQQLSAACALISSQPAEPAAPSAEDKPSS